MQPKLTPSKRIQLAIDNIQYANDKKQCAWLENYEFEQCGKGFESLKEKAYKEFLHYKRLESYYTSRLHEVEAEINDQMVANITQTGSV